MTIDFAIPPDMIEEQSKAESLCATTMQLIGTPGWRDIQRIIQYNIDLVKEEAFSVDPEPTEEQMKRLRDRLFFLEQLKDLPAVIVHIAKTDERSALSDMGTDALAQIDPYS